MCRFAVANRLALALPNLSLSRHGFSQAPRRRAAGYKYRFAAKHGAEVVRNDDRNGVQGPADFLSGNWTLSAAPLRLFLSFEGPA